ncbi:MAG TPA: flagellar biosynthesis protein FliQ [Candidatus Treponema faecavium]|nr:flagellar biosynthesis protein FliQ [Candidatus Treponema faecavium]
MSIGDLVTLMRGGVLQIVILSAPILGAAIIVGLIVAIFQATTSIQEQTLSFVPKLFAILAVLALLGAWMFATLREYTFTIFEMIGNMGR